MDTKPSYQLPEDLTSLTEEELNQHRADIAAAFDEAYDQPRTAENLETLRSLKDAADQVTAAVEQIRAMEAEAEQLARDMAGDDEDDDETTSESDDEATASDEEAPADDAPVDEGDTPAEDAPVEDAPVAEGDTPAEDANVPPTDSTESDNPDPEGGDVVDIFPDTEDDEEDLVTDTTQEPINVAASSSTQPASAPNLSPAAINAHTKGGGAGDDAGGDNQFVRKPATIVAAANNPAFDTGTPLTMRQVAEAFNARAKSFPRKPTAGQRIQATVAAIHKSFPDELRFREGEFADEAMEAAVDESRLPEGSLVAAGGWCAPSETWYDLVSMETDEGLLSLPTVGAPRGGIKHTLGPDFRSIYDGTGYFFYTEAEDAAGDYDGEGGGSKPSMVVPCPSFVEDRLDLDGLQITGGILQDTAYPEMTERFISGALVAHAHKQNARVIADLVSKSDAVSMSALGGPTTTLLSALEMSAIDMRYRQRMSPNATLEVILPYWTLGVLRADLSNRIGVENMLSVPDSEIINHIRSRQVNPQFVYDWQDDMADAASGFGDSVAQTSWPASVKTLMYPAGTFVKAEEDVITLDAIYDSVNIVQNNTTHLFTEEGWMVMKRSHDARVLTVALGSDYGDANAGT